jgi:hypothetical protein
MESTLYKTEPGVIAELAALPEPPVLLYALDGYLDAGFAAGVVISDLLSKGEAKRVATFDIDQLLDYRSRRPPMIWGPDGWTGFGRPELVVDMVRDAEGTPLLVMYGPEPDYRWEAFAAAVLELVEHLDVRLALGMHGVPKMVPHTRPAMVHGPGDNATFGDKSLAPATRLQAPGSAMALVEYQLKEVSRQAGTVTVDVPSYLAAVPYPAGAAALARGLGQASGLVLDTAAMDNAGQKARVQLDKQVAEAEDLAKTVAELERRYDKAYGQPDAQAAQVTGDDIAKELEAFLAEQSPGHDPGEQPGA